MYSRASTSANYPLYPKLIDEVIPELLLVILVPSGDGLYYVVLLLRSRTLSTSSLSHFLLQSPTNRGTRTT